METTSDFVTLAGKTQNEVDSKVTTAVNRFFGIGTGESTTPVKDTGYRCYYELPQDSSMAFIWAADSNDIRSEGMSYGRMIAVQMDMRTQFDKLWTFAKTYLQYPANTSTTAWRYYFKWQGTVNTASASNWTVNHGATTSGAVNYKQEADNIAAAMLNNVATSDARHPIIHTTENKIVFVPYGDSYGFSDHFTRTMRPSPELPRPVALATDMISSSTTRGAWS
jgi:oligosaccharide reducing-end xylanase